MDDWSGIAARLAVYVTLALAFGVPFQSLIDRRPIRRRSLLVMTAAALAASIAALLTLVAAMAGTAILPVDGATLRMVVTETPPGTAFMVRFAALGVAIAAACGAGSNTRSAVVCAGSGVALGTVAWTGHGAMQEGAAGTLHLVADILHLLAAAAWIGAIAVLLTWLSPGHGVAPDPAMAHAALQRFVTTGSVLVATVVATGLVNGWMIVGVDGMATLPHTLYGRLLFAKLVLFAAMLAFAARHRWMLGPRLHDAIRDNDSHAAVGNLRRSLALEVIVGVAILAIVACLGTLSPAS